VCLITKRRKAQQMTRYHVRTTIQDQKRLFINYRLQHPAYSDNVVFQLLSCIHLFAAPWTVACQPSLSFTIPLSLLNFMSIESAVPSNHLILCYPLLLLPSVFPRLVLFHVPLSDAGRAALRCLPEKPCTQYPPRICHESLLWTDFNLSFWG